MGVRYIYRTREDGTIKRSVVIDRDEEEEKEKERPEFDFSLNDYYHRETI